MTVRHRIRSGTDNAVTRPTRDEGKRSLETTERLAADTAYGSGERLAWLDDRQISPHIPVFDKTDRADGAFPHADFSFDPAADEYTCPGGNKLKKYWRTMSKPHSGTGTDGLRNHYASKGDCGVRSDACGSSKIHPPAG
jgi:hypothetical protein